MAKSFFFFFCSDFIENMNACNCCAFINKKRREEKKRKEMFWNEIEEGANTATQYV